MSGRSPIFSAKVEGELIGYVEGSKAFDKFGHLRCRYDEPSGNLSDLTSGKVVGHVSLEGKYVGLSWRADELFPKFDSGPLAGTETDGAESEEPGIPESRVSHPLDQVLAIASSVYEKRSISNLNTPTIPANTAQDVPFSDDVEKVFEMLRTRIGLPG